MRIESHIRTMIKHLLIEAKVDVLAARYPNIDVYAFEFIDPTPTKKYLEWLTTRVANTNVEDIEDVDLKELIHTYHNVQPRLRGKHRDINSFKTILDLQNFLKNVDTKSKTQQKKESKSAGSKQIASDIDGYDVYFVTSHQAAMLLGKGTKWCITQEDGIAWENYIMQNKFFFAIRARQQDDPLDKIAFACNNETTNIWDSSDEKLDFSDISQSLLSKVKSVAQQIVNYIITTKKQTLKFENNKFTGIFESVDGTKIWYVNGKRHREDGPAIEHPNGDKEWWLHGERHRGDGPAVENIHGYKEWYVNGKRHRDDGPAIEHPNGDKEWLINGKLHREDGPAIEWANGDKAWYVNGKRHREDGPAVELANGTKKWYIDNREYSKDEYQQALRNWWAVGRYK